MRDNSVLMAWPWSGVAQEDLSLEETEGIISETEEKSQEKNLNQRPLEEKFEDKKGCSKSLSRDIRSGLNWHEGHWEPQGGHFQPRGGGG